MVDNTIKVNGHTVVFNDDCMTIYNSYKVKKSSEINEFMDELIHKAPINVFNSRSVNSVIREWKAHNLLYYLKLFPERTKHVDVEYIQKWYFKVGYFILSLFYIW